MEITRAALAGTLESGDVLVQVEPGTNGVELELESVVLKQFGDDIRRTVLEVLAEQDVSAAKIKLVDKGAIDLVIRARVETCLLRGAKGEGQ